MTKIGVLSDTHGSLDDKILDFFKDCREVWHCGDFGSIKVADLLEERFEIFRGVYGNIDDYLIKRTYPGILIFECEKLRVVLTHIGGYPGHYEPKILPLLYKEKPGLFLCGHSHIAKVMYDAKLQCLHINPGAAGNQGFHRVRTAMRFIIEGKEIKNLEIIELERKYGIES